MATQYYEHIALNWRPDNDNNYHFLFIVTVALTLCLTAAIAINHIELPQQSLQKSEIPNRVAQFIKTTPKPKKIEVPKSKPKIPPPPKPKVARKKEKSKQPLTQEQKAARNKAEKSGILALSNEFSDLIDSSAVDAAVAVNISTETGDRDKVVGLSADAIARSAGKGSGGVRNENVLASISGISLDKAELVQVQQTLIQSDTLKNEDNPQDVSTQKSRGNHTRSEEEIQMVFDRNKGRLQSIYLRERRKSPGLKGTILLEITISPEGKVTNIRIVSSELNSPTLEKRLMARIRSFVFSHKSVESVTVTFPIEFLP